MIQKENNRDVFMTALIDAAKTNDTVVVLDADVSRTTRSRRFRDEYPDRFYDIGVAEQNMLGTAAGLASAGLEVVAFSFSVFTSTRAIEMIRTSVCYPKLNVKVIGAYAGLSNAKDGATHQSLEDFGMTLSIPNLVVLSVSDAVVASKIPEAMLNHNGPVYVRLEFSELGVINDPSLPFEIGKGIINREGGDVTLVSTGAMLEEVVAAADMLAEEGISAEIIDMPSLKPFDSELLINSAKKTGIVVSCEIHNVTGGLGSVCAKELMENGVFVKYGCVGIQDRFTESGKYAELLDKYSISRKHIYRKVKDMLVGYEGK